MQVQSDARGVRGALGRSVCTRHATLVVSDRAGLPCPLYGVYLAVLRHEPVDGCSVSINLHKSLEFWYH